VLQYLDDILEAINNIEEDTAGISFDEFVADRRRKDAVILRRPAGVPVTITDTF
jgi:uncharacterized protein with HEPN domain